MKKLILLVSLLVLAFVYLAPEKTARVKKTFSRSLDGVIYEMDLKTHELKKATLKKLDTTKAQAKQTLKVEAQKIADSL